MKIDVIKLLNFLATGLTIGSTIMSNVSQEKALKKLVDEAVKKELQSKK